MVGLLSEFGPTHNQPRRLGGAFAELLVEEPLLDVEDAGRTDSIAPLQPRRSSSGEPRGFASAAPVSTPAMDPAPLRSEPVRSRLPGGAETAVRRSGNRSSPRRLTLTSASARDRSSTPPGGFAAALDEMGQPVPGGARAPSCARSSTLRRCQRWL
jgi:hypothetical protein